MSRSNEPPDTRNHIRFIRNPYHVNAADNASGWRLEMLKKGTQIAYIPNHANGDINHADVQFGFITNVVQMGYRENDLTYFCRFWRKDEPGVLRTTSVSEVCFDYQLVEHRLVSDEVINNTFAAIRANK